MGFVSYFDDWMKRVEVVVGVLRMMARVESSSRLVLQLSPPGEDEMVQ